jgi:glycosyltransferase involved in cell wall biosynthesis
MPDKIDVSIVLPVYNEAESLKELHSKLTDALTKLGLEYEIIAIDDGSKDSSFKVLKELSQSDPKLKAIKFRRNF